MLAPADKDDQGKDNTAIEQYKENLKVYNAWFKRDLSTCCTLLSCMQDNILGEFERFSIAKDIWARVKIRFGQTFAARLRTLQLKWMQHIIDSSCTTFEHLQATSAVVRDLKGTGQDVFEEEHELSVIRALSNDNEHWRSFKVIMCNTRVSNLILLLIVNYTAVEPSLGCYRCIPFLEISGYVLKKKKL